MMQSSSTFDTGEFQMKSKLVAAAIIASSGVAGPAFAHHSYAMFDKSREIEMRNAVVVEWQWTSPHTWLYVIVPGPGGAAARYSIEGGNPGLMRRLRFAKGSFAPGDRLTIYVSPLRSGQPGGALNAARLANGTMLGERLNGAH
jgi:hypothetical protein